MPIKFPFTVVSPILISTPSSKTVVEGYSASFTCLVQTANPADVNLVWTFRNIALDDRLNEKYQVEIYSTNSNTVGYNLTIFNVDPSDAGVYTCFTQNSAGSDSGSGTLSVFG